MIREWLAALARREAERALAADVARRKLMIGEPYRARREAALKATRPT